MIPVEKSDEQKLRVCYKHFRNSDYRYSTSLRILMSSAVPSIYVSSDEEDITETELNNLEERKSDMPQETDVENTKTNEENSIKSS
ncbi:hypothetical protein EAI_03276 [Harpegnathos saltator]|uniref:THAP-type domain-containing protein n=1 Tax=Harpegnathos saltator TaxID=610380 RepID=E2B6G8_HARSA|nr:hypothetical protein EAI_03276 [Harpegnathos saltator]